MRSNVLLLIAIIPFFSCNNTGKNESNAEQPHLVLVKTFEDDFEHSAIQPFWEPEVEDQSRLNIVEDPIDSGNKVIQVTLKPGDFVHHGHRSEMMIQNHINKAGRIVKYSFDFMLRKGFFENKPPQKWIIIHQWHDQPPEGVSWDDYPGNHAPVNLYIGTSSNPETFKLALAHGLWGTVKGKKLKEDTNLIYNKELKPNTWYTFENTIRWDTTHKGYVLPKINGINMVHSTDGKSYNRNMYNSMGNYTKIGFYADKTLGKEIQIYYDNFDCKVYREKE